MNKETQLTAIDLFSGIGGFHLAAQDLGIQVTFASEFDPIANRTYTANLGLEPYGDIKKHINDIPDHDILMAGFPCQAFSLLGQQRGFDDPRGQLIFDIAKITRLKRPPAIILENVVHLIHRKGGSTYKAIRQLFTSQGYDIQYKIINALDCGLPQSRNRLIIIGLRNINPPLVWPTYTGQNKTLADILESDVDSKYFPKQSHKDLYGIKERDYYQQSLNPFVLSTHRSNYPRKVRPYAMCLIGQQNKATNQLVNAERIFTPRERLRLQGFPDWYSINEPYPNILQLTGNACPPPIAKIPLQYVKNALEQN